MQDVLDKGYLQGYFTPGELDIQSQRAGDHIADLWLDFMAISPSASYECAVFDY